MAKKKVAMVIEDTQAVLDILKVSVSGLRFSR